MSLLSGGRVFFLSASPAVILRRVQEEDAGGPIRPLLAVDDPEARIAELLEQRATAYAQAHHTRRDRRADGGGGGGAYYEHLRNCYILLALHQSLRE